jgi:PmbA protein
MSANQSSMTGLAQSLVAYGRKQGASEIEVSIREGTESRINVLNQNIDNLTESLFKRLDIRAFVDGKAASASSSDFTRETLDRLVDNAIARARLGGKDPFAGLPDLEPVRTKAEVLKIYDPAILELTAEKKIAVARQLEAIGLKDTRIKKSTGSSCNSFFWNTVLANSKGFSGAYRRSVVTCGVGFQSGEGENLIQDGWYDSSTRLADLQQPETVAKKAVERVARLIGARKVETQNVPVVFDPTMGAWLLGFLSQCVAGISIARRQSFLTDKLGTKVGNELVNVMDDGLLVGGRGTVPFDGEGVPCRKTPVIEGGVLKNYLLDTYWGRKLKQPSTGNAGGPNNLYWVAGKSSPEEMIKSVEKGLYLTGFLGLGREATTGDISVGAFGLWIEKGELAFPVAEITISANLGALLQNVEMVGNDLELRDAISAPTIKFAEITVGGMKTQG